MGIENIFSVLVIVLTSILAFLFTRKKKLIALDPEEYIDFKLIEKKIISHDTRLFRFGLQSEKHVLGLPIGQHISFQAEDEQGKIVARSYTPTSLDSDVGHVDFVIKIYFANVHPKFPEGGKMTQILEKLKIGDTMKMRGPKGNLTYKGHGLFHIKIKNEIVKKQVKNIGMIAGGTGITPMYQIMQSILKDPSDPTFISLLYANQTEEDILLREQLEQFAGDDQKLKLWYTLDRPGENWAYSQGFVNAEMVRKHLPPPGPDTLLLVCGPPPMIKFACIPAFTELGYTEDMYFTF